MIPGVKISTGGMLALIAAIGVGLVLLAKKGGSLASALNPLDPNNAAATAVNTLGGSIYTAPDDPGKNADGSWSLGGWIFDELNPSTAQAVKDITSTSTPATTAPLDTNTVFGSSGGYYSQPGALY